MAARLKTYAAEIDGLHDWIVAAPNQTAALEAFGVNQNLFAQGAARIEVDADRVKSAASHPGVPLRRRKGTSDAFAPVASNAAGDWSAALEAAVEASVKASGPGKSARKVSPPEPQPPSRRALDKAETVLAEAEEDRDQALADIEEAQRTLNARAAQLKARFKERIDEARARVKAEAAAFRQAGGRT